MSASPGRGNPFFYRSFVMSLAFPSPPLPEAARPPAVACLALTYAGLRLPLQVCRSAAGYYLGAVDDDGPVSRESAEYFPTHRAASLALASGRWQQRRHP
jgi:hypothetical protein